MDIFDEYHELVNPFVMNKEIKKKVYFDELNYMIERKYMSRTTPTILCNLCMVEDLENGKVVLQYRSPEKTHWAGYAFPGGHIEEGESLVESVIREIYEETGLTITNPKLVAVKDWPQDEGGRYIVFCYKATEFYRPAKIV